MATFTYGSDLATAPCYLPTDKELSFGNGRITTITLTIMRSKIQVQVSNYATDWNTVDGENGSSAIPTLGYRYDETSNTYTVLAPMGLDAWRTAVESGNTTANCILEADIDYGGNEWLPIAASYKVTFDGAGHTISNLTFNPELSSGGLFKILLGKVQGLTVEGIRCTTTSGGSYGVIASESEGTISDCIVRNCRIACEMGTCGGIVGENRRDGIVSDCQVDYGDFGGHQVGDIAGYNYGTVNSCLVKIVTLKGTQIGGLVGYNYESSAVLSGYRVEGGTFYGFYAAGGLAANNYGLIEDAMPNIPRL